MTDKTQSIVWGEPIKVDGVRPEWLRDYELVMDHDPGEPTHGEVRGTKEWGWFLIKSFRLPADHPYYTVQRYNAKHGTKFVYWPGGDDAPADVERVLFRNGDPYTCVNNGRGFRWIHSGSKTCIIGYIKKEQPMKTEDEIPEWALKRADALIIKTGDTLHEGFARYIAQHEEPPVDPDLLLAREAAATCGWSEDHPDLWYSGDKDHLGPVVGALRAIKLYKERNA